MLEITGFFITGNIRDGPNTHRKMTMADAECPGDTALNADPGGHSTTDTASKH